MVPSDKIREFEQADRQVSAVWVKPSYRQISAGSAEAFGTTLDDSEFTKS